MPPRRPYDVIVMQGAIEDVPAATRGPTRGRRPIWSPSSAMVAQAERRSSSAPGTDVAGRIVFDTTAAPLPGFAKGGRLCLLIRRAAHCRIFASTCDLSSRVPSRWGWSHIGDPLPFIVEPLPFIHLY